MEPDERAARADAYESVRSEIVDLVPAEVPARAGPRLLDRLAGPRR